MRRCCARRGVVVTHGRENGRVVALLRVAASERERTRRLGRGFVELPDTVEVPREDVVREGARTRDERAPRPGDRVRTGVMVGVVERGLEVEAHTVGDEELGDDVDQPVRARRRVGSPGRGERVAERDRVLRQRLHLHEPVE